MNSKFVFVLLLLLPLVCLLNCESLQILQEHRARELQNKQKHIRYDIIPEIISHIQTADLQSIIFLPPKQGITGVALKEDSKFIFPCRWMAFAEGSLRCIDMSSVQALGPNLSFTRQRYTVTHVKLLMFFR